MSEVVRRIYLPFIASAVVYHWVFFRTKDSIGGQVPHLWITVLQVLLHAKNGLLRLVFAIPHPSEFGQGLNNGTVSMCAGISGFILAPTTLGHNFGLYNWY